MIVCKKYIELYEVLKIITIIIKCALFYERRSGNNWYRGKGGKKRIIKVQGETIATYKRSESYTYLGKSLTVEPRM